MIRDVTVSLCLPCRNEGDHLPEVFRRIPAEIDEVIVVSNCSTDDTVQVARRLGARVIEDDRILHGIGYGFAHMTALEAASSEVIVAADGDASYPVEKIVDIVGHMIDNGLDVVSCSRYPLQDGTDIPWKLRIGVAILNWEVRILFGQRLKDVLSGMWVVRRSVLPLLDLSMGDWNLSPEIKLQAMCNPSICFGEFGIVQHDRFGTSHQRHFRTGVSHALWILKHGVTRARATKVPPEPKSPS